MENGRFIGWAGDMGPGLSSPNSEWILGGSLMSKPEKLLAKVTRGGLNKMAGAAGEKMSGGFVLGTRMGMRVEKIEHFGTWSIESDVPEYHNQAWFFHLDLKGSLCVLLGRLEYDQF